MGRNGSSQQAFGKYLKSLFTKIFLFPVYDIQSARSRGRTSYALVSFDSESRSLNVISGIPRCSHIAPSIWGASIACCPVFQERRTAKQKPREGLSISLFSASYSAPPGRFPRLYSEKSNKESLLCMSLRCCLRCVNIKFLHLTTFRWYRDNASKLTDRPPLRMLDEARKLPDKAERRSQFSHDPYKSRASGPYQVAPDRI